MKREMMQLTFRYSAFPLLQFWAILLILVLFFLAGCNTTKPQEASSDKEENKTETEIKFKVGPLPGYIAPDFELEDLTGEKIRLSSLRGKIVVINFWSLGCKYCLQIMPDFDEFNRSKPEDVEVLMINLDVDNGTLPLFIENQGFTFKVLKDEKGEAAIPYVIYATPATFIINKNGIISKRIEGPLNKDYLDGVIAEVKQES